MGIRKVAAALTLIMVLSAAAGCAGDSCACSYPDEDHQTDTRKHGDTKHS
jgi:hypothetical protein